MAHVVLMPKAGQSMTEGRIVTWFKSEGDEIGRGEPLMEIETDKANLEVEAIDAGVVRKIFVEAGDSCDVLTAVAIVGTADEDIDFDKLRQEAADKAKAANAEEASAKKPAAKKPAAAKKAKKPKKSAPAPSAAPVAAMAAPALTAAPIQAAGVLPGVVSSVDSKGRRILASPLAKRLAAERGVQLADLQGSGPGGRILKRDVESAPAGSRNGAAPAAPVLLANSMPYPAPAEAPPESVPLEGMRLAIAKALTHSKSNIPHFYTTVSIDMTQALNIKASYAHAGSKITVNDLVVRAVSRALQDEPSVNCRVFDDRVEYPEDINVGIAVGSDDGLVVPVLIGTQDMDLGEIATNSRAVVASAQAGKLVGTGQGTFTISNLGMFGVESFTAIINPPEGAILAVGGTHQQMVPVGGGFFAKPIMKVTLSCDHRAIDGLLAARFLQRLRFLLEHGAL